MSDIDKNAKKRLSYEENGGNIGTALAITNTMHP
jgi:hypothetical protein